MTRAGKAARHKGDLLPAVTKTSQDANYVSTVRGADDE